jgi:hypothetical protein
MCPCPSQEESYLGLWPLLLIAASGFCPRHNNRPGIPVTRLPLAHTDRRVLAEPYKDNKKPGQGQFLLRQNPAPTCSPSPVPQSAAYGTENVPELATPVANPLFTIGCNALADDCETEANQTTLVPDAGDTKPVRPARDGKARLVDPLR